MGGFYFSQGGWVDVYAFIVEMLFLDHGDLNWPEGPKELAREEVVCCQSSHQKLAFVRSIGCSFNSVFLFVILLSSFFILSFFSFSFSRHHLGLGLGIAHTLHIW